jgi:hypothetical protein
MKHDGDATDDDVADVRGLYAMKIASKSLDSTLFTVARVVRVRKTRNGRVAPAAASSLVLVRVGDYSERRKATRSVFSCLVNLMLNRVS